MMKELFLASLLVGVAGAQDDEGGLGTIEENVVAVGEAGDYNILGTLGLWAVGSAVDTVTQPLFMHRAEIGLDMTFDSWLFGMISVQSWGNETRYNEFHIAEAYMEAYFADWFSLRAGKQLLFYGDGLVWSDRLRGYPALSLLFGDNLHLNLHGIYSEPAVITERPSWMAGAEGGAGFGPLYASVYALSRPTPPDTGGYDLWAGGRLELEAGFLRVAAEGAGFNRDTITSPSGLVRAELTPRDFILGGAVFQLDSSWVNPFGQNIVFDYDATGWGGLGEVYTFYYAPNPFLTGVSNLSAVNLHLGYSRYLDFVRPDLIMTARVDLFKLSSAFTSDSSVDIGNELDVSFNFEVTRVVRFGLAGGFLMAGDDSYQDGTAVRAWIVKDFFFE